MSRASVRLEGRVRLITNLGQGCKPATTMNQIPWLADDGVEVKYSTRIMHKKFFLADGTTMVAGELGVAFLDEASLIKLMLTHPHSACAGSFSWSESAAPHGEELCVCEGGRFVNERQKRFNITWTHTPSSVPATRARERATTQVALAATRASLQTRSQAALVAAQQVRAVGEEGGGLGLTASDARDVSRFLLAQQRPL